MMDSPSQTKGIVGAQSDDEDFKSATSEQDDNGEPHVGVAEALRDMGNTDPTGGAPLLNPTNEVQAVDSRKDGAEQKTNGDVAEMSSELAQLDVISLECQKFLVDIDCAKASQFLSKSVGELAEMYQEWRRERDPNNQIAVGSARIYLNKWRKRLRDEVEKEGKAKAEDLGDDVDFVIANPERIARAESDKAKREKAAASTSERLSLSSVSPTKTCEIKYVSLTLSEPGTFGLKVENTLSNGVRISDVIPGLQGDRAGFQKGDIVASASMDETNFEPDKTTLWGKDMAFDDFVKVAQSEKRPIIVRVRRGGPEDEILEKIKQKKTFKKRGRPKKDDSEKKPRKRGRKRTKPTPQALHKFEVRRLRAMREEIIRAHSLRIAADAIDKSMIKALKDNPMARQKVNETAQIMREESTELWDNPSHGEWEGHLKNLLVFKQLSGHTVVPKTHPDKELLKFLTYMRTTKKSLNKGEFKKTKRKEKAKIEVEIFDQIGFMWKPTTKVKGWLETFKELEEYKDRHGTCMIPKQKKGSEYRNLFLWVNLQRRKYDTKSLPDSQIKRLSDLGMVWNLKDQKSWDDHLEDLLEYKLKNGNCKVPAIYKPNRPLGKWVDKMRQEKELREQGETSDVLTDERVKMLDYFGFAWDVSKHTPRKRAASDSEDEDDTYESGEENKVVRPRKKNKVGRPSLGRSWEEYYEDLVDFERRQGHCKVPQNYPANRPLGSWVNRMRQQKKKDGDRPSDILTVERLRKLDEIGFLWSARDGRGRRSIVPKDDDSSDASWAGDDDGVKASWPKRSALKHDLFAKVSGKDLSNHGQETVPIGTTTDGAVVDEALPKDMGFLISVEKTNEFAEETKADGGPAPELPKQADETKGLMENAESDNKGVANSEEDGEAVKMDTDEESAPRKPEQVDGTMDGAADLETGKPDDEGKIIGEKSDEEHKDDDDKVISEKSDEEHKDDDDKVISEKSDEEHKGDDTAISEKSDEEHKGDDKVISAELKAPPQDQNSDGPELGM